MTFSNSQRFFVISYHDLIPQTQPQCQRFINRLEEMGIHRISLLVTPKWYNGPSIEQSPPFFQWLRLCREKGHEVVLHGLTHQVDTLTGGMLAQIIGRYYTNREGEFYQLNQEQAQQRLQSGIRIFEAANLPIDGFIPPAWLLSSEARKALIETNIPFTTSWGFVENLQTNQQVYAPAVVFSSRNFWRRFVSVGWCRFWNWYNRNTPIIRLAVHPSDFNHHHIEERIYHIVRKMNKDRISVTYSELLKMVQ